MKPSDLYPEDKDAAVKSIFIVFGGLGAFFLIALLVATAPLIFLLLLSLFVLGIVLHGVYEDIKAKNARARRS